MDFIKIKHFCSLKNAIIKKNEEWQAKLKTERKPIANYCNCRENQLQISEKGFVSNIHKNSQNSKSRKTAQWKAGQKISKRYSIKNI